MQVRFDADLVVNRWCALPPRDHLEVRDAE